MYVFLCEDNIDGIFTAIYDAWASHFGHKNIYILSKEPQNYELFCEYISVKTNMEKKSKSVKYNKNTLWSRSMDIFMPGCHGI